MRMRLLMLCVLACGACWALPAEDRQAKALEHFIRGTVAEQSEDHFRAIYDFQEALHYDSSSAFIHTALAQSYLSVGSFDKAEQALEKALRLDPAHVPALELKSLLLRGTSRFAEARKTLETLRAARPDDQNYVRELLSILMTLQDYNAADKLFSAIEADSAEQSILNRQMSAVYLNAKEFTRSLPYLATLRSLDPEDGSVFFSSGTAYLQLGDTAKAVECMDRAAQLEPKEPRFWNGRAIVALNQQHYLRAIELADSGLAVAGPHEGLYNTKGVSFQRLSRLPEAIESLKLAIATDTTFYNPMGTLALIYDGLDSLDQAVHFYELAIQYSDSAAVFLNNLAYTFAVRTIRLPEARQLAELALVREPDNSSYKDTMGWIEYGFGNHEEALHWLKEAAKDSPESAEVLEHIGDVYQAKGSDAKAREYYRKALALDPENEKLLEKTRP